MYNNTTLPPSIATADFVGLCVCEGERERERGREIERKKEREKVE
jgi:hypothetical protein